MSDPSMSHESEASMHHDGLKHKPTVHLVGGDALIWSVEDARHLREQHRIVAGPVGSLPRNPLQNIFLSLPLKLQPEELYLLLRRGLIQVVDEANAYEPPQATASQATSSEFIQVKQGEPSKTKSTSVTIRTLSSWLPWYRHHPSKPQDLQDFRNSQGILSSTSVNTTNKNYPSSPTLTSRPAVISSLHDPYLHLLLCFPRDEQDRLRLHMYEYLWDTYKFYIAPGFKFGGDYLLYASDPLTCHAGWIASAKSLQEPIAARDLASMARLASSVQKSHVFCSFEVCSSTGEAEVDPMCEASVQPSGTQTKLWCFSIEWAGF